MKKIILSIVTIAIVFLSATSVSSSEKEPVVIDFPDGHQVIGYVKECELEPYECTIALTNGSVYTVMYTQVDDLTKICFTEEALEYAKHAYQQA